MRPNIRSWLTATVMAAMAGGTAYVTLAMAQPSSPLAPADAHELRPPAAFDALVGQRSRSIALFEEAGKVLTHPRCVNCHPAGDRPLQTDRGRPHQPPVVRGDDGHGAPGLRCTACHGGSNFDAARVPGHPEWHLAPVSMAWQGRSLGQICEQIKDPARNGGKDLQALIRHMAEDTLVGWAWSPGRGRAPAPGTQARFGELVRAWVDSGAHCPG